MRSRTLLMLLLAVTLGAGGCRDGEPSPPARNAAAEQSAAPPPSNRIDVPATVRQNLGITFAKVEKRKVSSTIRVPGRFEFLPSARREYRSTLPGWVRLHVGQYDEVAKGAKLYELDSPQWHRLRRQLHESQASIEKATAELDVARKSKAEAEVAVKALEQRVAALAGAEVRRAELDAELATRRASLPRLDAEIEVKHAALGEARHDFALEVDTAASLLGVSAAFLTETADVPQNELNTGKDHEEHHQVQRWFAISRLEQAATGQGVVETLHVTDGTWADENTLIATVVNPTALRFRATGLQSDLGVLRDGLPVHVVPPQGSGIDPADVLAGTLKVGISGNADDRTIELLAHPQKLANWAKPGVSALLEVAVDGTGKEELAIPASAVLRDELTHVFFRRDPRNPDKVIRMEADLGASDGKWIVVQSGLKAGDEVVLDGVYELKLAGAGKVGGGGGGHFHADGSWHAEADKK
jgi:multidrug efflux pump subunit AcrA (membrane-fusion protein)